MTRQEEVALKHARVRNLLAAEGLAAVLLKKQANFSWFTGGGLNLVGIATETGVTSLLITPTARYVIANRIESGRMMVEEGLGELGFELLEHEWYQDREAELVAQVAGDLSRAGCDLPYRDCRNVDEGVKQLRYSLTENEVERYLFLGEKLSAGLEQVMLGIRPGDTELEIAGRIGGELWKHRIDPTALLVAADDRISSYRHPIPTDTVVRRYVMVAVNARYKGLIAALTRFVHFGRPPAGLVRQYADNVEIESRMIAATRPGVPLSESFLAGVRAYAELGYGDEWRFHHQGGAMGYSARDIKATAETTAVVEPYQAFCWNPSIKGTKSEDGFIATPEGPLFITRPVLYPSLEIEAGGVRMVRPGMMIVE